MLLDSIHPEERSRFLLARPGDLAAAEDMLRRHLAWRAATLPLAAGAPRIGDGLPPLLTMLERDSISGKRVLLMTAAMFDHKLASMEVYISAVAAYIDASLERTSDEKLTVVIDSRGGRGWANPKPWTMLPFIRASSRILSDNFPERCGRALHPPPPPANPLAPPRTPSTHTLQEPHPPTASTNRLHQPPPPTPPPPHHPHHHLHPPTLQGTTRTQPPPPRPPTRILVAFRPADHLPDPMDHDRALDRGEQVPPGCHRL